MLVVISGLIVWAWASLGVHKKWYQDALEASFLFNLIALIGGTYQVHQSTHNQGAVVYTSISITFVTFTGIIIAAVVQRLQKTQFGKTFTHKIKIFHQIGNEEEPNEQPTTPLVTATTFSVVEIERNQPQESMTSDYSDYRESVIKLAEESTHTLHV